MCCTSGFIPFCLEWEIFLWPLLIHPSICFLSPLILHSRSQRWLQPSLAVTWQRMGYTSRKPVCSLHPNVCGLWDVGGITEKPRRHREKVEIKVGTSWLWRWLFWTLHWFVTHSSIFRVRKIFSSHVTSVRSPSERLYLAVLSLRGGILSPRLP